MQTENAMQKLFIYGTLRFTKYQKEALGRAVTGKQAVLRGYRRMRVAYGRRKYFAIIPDPAAATHGLLLSVSRDDLRHLDIYEGKYIRRRVTLKDGTRAWVYHYTSTYSY